MNKNMNWKDDELASQQGRIMELQQEHDKIITRCRILEAMAKQHYHMFLDDGYIEEAEQIMGFLGSAPEQNLAEIEKKAIEGLIEHETSIARMHNSDKRSIIFVSDAKKYADSLLNK